MRKTPKKLAINKDTMRVLTTELDIVRGGVIDTFTKNTVVTNCATCSPTCETCTSI